MQKKRVIKSMESLSDEVYHALKTTYPEGWSNHVMKVNKGNKDFFHAVSLETEDTSYLIKVKVKIDKQQDLAKINDPFDEDISDELQPDERNEDKDQDFD